MPTENLGLWTMQDMARAFDVTRQTVTAWVRDGVMLPPMRIGRRVYWRERDVRVWVNRHPPVGYRYHGNVLPWERGK